jgi:hypothetical protein
MTEPSSPGSLLELGTDRLLELADAFVEAQPPGVTLP